MIGAGFSRILLSLFYGTAGMAHLLMPGPFVAIVPEIVPFKAQVVFITGILEIAGAIGLHLPAFRRAAGLGLALYALAVWPANVRHALLGLPVLGLDPGWWYHGPRLALQPVLIWWAVSVARR